MMNTPQTVAFQKYFPETRCEYSNVRVHKSTDRSEMKPRCISNDTTHADPGRLCDLNSSPAAPLLGEG